MKKYFLRHYFSGKPLLKPLKTPRQNVITFFRCVNFQDVKRSISEKWTRHQLQRGSLLLEYDSDLLYRLKDYIKYCTQFAWCAVTQVPPLKIDYKTTDYDTKVHGVSQAFSPSEERSPSRRKMYSETRKIMCYLWPTLLDCDGKVIRKGEVLLL